MPRYVIGQPCDGQRLRRIAAAHDQEKREVLDACGEVLLGEQETVADCGDGQAAQGEGIAVPQPIGRVGRP